MEALHHRLDPTLLNKRVQIHIAGMGGNGAQMAACLARLDRVMLGLGHPFGLSVVAIDPAKVSAANVGRQLFSEADIGLHKAVVSINRLNQFWGLDWMAYPCTIHEYWQSHGGSYGAQRDILISCVDTRAARRDIHTYLFARKRYAYWLDLGNRESDAQVILGEPVPHRSPDSERGPRLPCVTELFPELLDPMIADDNKPSCSVRMSVATQGLFTNDIVVRFASQLLFELFSQGSIEHHGVMCNLASKRTAPIAIDRETWRRFGYQ
ncbi:PRTRC system ThiF family protein [Janthinobacterium sp. NKUCC06_STL]|uniref:PRTRC system ThiF family protein n=1 Tax=Janthinobacterium sp. NKUCC06_STL TaxID=2842127 RepID=UPI00214B0DA2|nr:PRTRC system ThiF family protein [Janthinobacterium sp. NKUCC06_STL]